MVDTANSIFKAMLVTIEVASKGTPRAIKNPERCLLCGFLKLSPFTSKAPRTSCTTLACTEASE